MSTAPKTTSRATAPAAAGTDRHPARHPRLSLPIVPSAPAVMGNRAFMRAWAARRAKLAGGRSV